MDRMALALTLTGKPKSLWFGVAISRLKKIKVLARDSG